MREIHRFEDLMVWQEGKELFKQIYMMTKDWKEYYFRDQICKASLSIINNIAEGYERKNTGEYIYFLSIAKGSAGEVRSMLIVMNELSIIDSEFFEQQIQRITSISKMLHSLIQKLKK